MKRKSASQSAFFNVRVLIASTLCLTGIFLALGSTVSYSAQPRANAQSNLVMPDLAAGGPCTLVWQPVANMPQDFYGGAAASNGTYAYVAGGYSFTTGTSVSTLYRFDPGSNTWSTMAPFSGPGFIMASAVYYPTTNKIYVFGGEDVVSGTNYNTTRIYDITSNTWTTGANMPDVRSFMGSGYNSGNGKIYLVSGYNTGQVSSAQPDTWEYDPVANTFTSKAPIPHPTGGMASGVIAGHLYVSGGRDAGNTVINLTWDYNIAANTWTAKANQPGAQNNVPGSAVAQSLLWVFGGGNPFESGDQPSTTAAFPLGSNGKIPATTNSTLTYDPTSDTWMTTTANMTAARSFPGGTSINNKLVAAGGFNGATTVASAETLDTCVSVPTVSGAVSRKVHGGAGTFDINLPLTGTPGIEDRIGGATNDYTMVVTFATNVTVTGSPQAQVTLGTGCVGSGGICNGGTVTVSGAVVTIPLTNVADDQTINVQLNGVSDGTVTGNVVIPMSRVAGDTNGNGIANSSDIAQTKGRVGLVVDGTNFRSDVNANGAINSTDVTIIKQQ